MVELYRLLLDRVAKNPLRDRFIDLTHICDRGEKLQYYADSVHPNFAGQQMLARALLQPALNALKDARPVPDSWERCERLR